MALLNQAILPNLVQTLENSPVLVHGGPVATRSHGCNSVISTRAALKMSDYTVVESGFGADIGAEKFLNITCRQAGFAPNAVVLVTTIRTLKMHGGLQEEDADTISYDALETGLSNLGRHIENLRLFGVPVVVAINRVTQRLPQLKFLRLKPTVPRLLTYLCPSARAGRKAAMARSIWRVKSPKPFARRAPPSSTSIHPTCRLTEDKVETVARKIYRARRGTIQSRTVREQLAHHAGGRIWPPAGLPVENTPYSFSADPDRDWARRRPYPPCPSGQSGGWSWIRGVHDE